MNVAVVILNWNGVDYLKKFIPTILEFSSGASIYVADNASSDESVTYLKENHPSVKLIINKENGGFAKGYNEALKNIPNYQYYILLNSDVEVTPNWINPVINYMNQNEDVAACMPKMKSLGNRDFFDHAGAAGGFIDIDGFPFCRGRIMNAVEKDLGQYNTPLEIFWATGACLFIRSKIFHQMKGFDEDFFAHMEEIDLCWRIKNQGHKIMYCPDSVVYHVGGGTLSTLSPKKLFLNFRNNLFLLTKNYHQSSIYSKLAYRLVLDGIAAIKFLTEGKFHYFMAVFKAHLAFYGKFGIMLKKRKALAKTQNLTPNLKGIYKRSIIFDFFVKKRKTFNQLPFN